MAKFRIGQRVRIVQLPAYVKTAEPMPMLRPAQVIEVGEEGVILAYTPGGDWSVRCQRGAYLLGEAYLEAVEP
ncbi:MAG: DUF3148 domain-containing protein [Gloeomargarita sp. HHBFW_bins_162]